MGPLCSSFPLALSIGSVTLRFISIIEQETIAAYKKVGLCAIREF